MSARLRSASLRVSDFEEIINEANQKDFLYIDPPYTVMHNNNNFIKYNATLFSWNDQLRLAGAIRRAVSRDVFVMMSNADHESVRALYSSFGYTHRLNRASVLSADASFRTTTSEILFTI